MSNLKIYCIVFCQSLQSHFHPIVGAALAGIGAYSENISSLEGKRGELLPGKIFLVTGGTRSGKSAFAERLAAQISAVVSYIATAVITDEEMQARVDLHQRRRPAGWETLEEPYCVSDLIGKIGAPEKVFLLDCLSVYVSNLLWRNNADNDEENRAAVLAEVRAILQAAKNTGSTLIIVSSEVGLGLVPDNRLGRFYRDLLGEANQEVAETAEEVYFVASGIPLALKRLHKFMQSTERD